MNTPAPLSVEEAEQRVLGWQAKLHRWAEEDSERRFGDLFNLLCEPATLLVAWERVKRNRGSQTAGVDGRAGPRWRPGKARCLLMRAGRGGAVVVLRGRESRPHGKGRQQDRGLRSRSGGRT